MLEKKIVHLPESALRAGGFGSFSGLLRVWMNSRAGIMAERKPQLKS